MIIKAFGILDILAGLLFFIDGTFFKSNLLPDKILWIIALYLIIKGMIFLLSFDVASAMDIICGIIIIFAISFTLPEVLVAIIGIYLVQKGAFSLLS